MSSLTLQAIARDSISYPFSELRSNRALIQTIQQVLNRSGFPVGEVTGMWNWNTEQAYRSFARKQGFPLDELTPQAAKFLLNVPPAPVPIPAPTRSAPPSPTPTPTLQPPTPVRPTPPSPPPAPAPPTAPTPQPPSPAPSNAFFEEALRFTLRWEGGYVNHPNDRGGETNKGVTFRTYNDYRRRKGLPLQSVRLITDTEVHEIYETMYWRPAQCDKMGRHLAIVHFDTAVNFGVGGSTLFLQQSLEVPVDRTFGPVTMSAVQRANAAEVAQRYCQLRIDFRHRRVQQDPSQQVFLRGWLNRDNDLLRYLSSLR